MFNGYLTFGGEEIANHARTEAYLREGYTPVGSVTTAEEPDDLVMLAQILGDPGGYSTPVNDRAPWVESGDPDTWDFAGPIILEVTGADGSTRSADVTEFANDGGVVGRARYGTRTIAVTALLAGRTGASALAGLAWLSSALAGSSCVSCMGEELCAFSALPDEFTDGPIRDADPVTEPVDRRVDGWRASRGRFRSRDGWFDPTAAKPGQVALYGIGRYGISTYGGTESFEPYLVAPDQDCFAGPVTWRWNLSTVRGPAAVSVGAMDSNGQVLTRSATQTLQGDVVLPFSPDPAWESWRPVLWVDGNPVRIAPTITHAPYRLAEDCADTYLRSYLDVATVEGPLVVQQVDFPCGEFALKVEWTWVVGNPFIFGAINPLVTDFSTATSEAAATEPGVVPLAITPAGSYMSADVCTPSTVSTYDLIQDPLCPAFIPPPRPPQVTDACWSPPQSWRRWSFSVPARLAPANNDGLLTFAFTNDHKEKRGVRVRLYPDPLGRGMDALDECAYCAEFNLTYIPPDATVTIDAARRRVETAAPGLDPVNTAATVRGDHGAPFDYPALQCNTPYLVVLDLPAGQPGDVRFEMSLRLATV